MPNELSVTQNNVATLGGIVLLQFLINRNAIRQQFMMTVLIKNPACFAPLQFPHFPGFL